MATEESRAIVYRVYEAINARDAATLDELFDPQVVRHAAGEVGREAARRAMEQAYEGFPETHFVVEDVLADGDRAALRVTVHGRPGQSLLTILEIFRIENGRVMEIWGAGIRSRSN